MGNNMLQALALAPRLHTPQHRQLMLCHVSPNLFCRTHQCPACLLGTRESRCSSRQPGSPPCMSGTCKQATSNFVQLWRCPMFNMHGARCTCSCAAHQRAALRLDQMLTSHRNSAAATHLFTSLRQLPCRDQPLVSLWRQQHQYPMGLLANTQPAAHSRILGFCTMTEGLKSAGFMHTQ
jgi:hypothetical protein